MENKKPTTAQEKTSTEIYPGAAVDINDDEKVDGKLVKERTRTLNNNPRNTDEDDC